MTELSCPQRVLYVVSRFPWISTTFTANEMAAMVSEGVDVFVAPIWKTPLNHTAHELEKPFLLKIVRPTWRQRDTWFKMFKGLLWGPQVFWLIVRLIPGHIKSVYLPLKLLSAIPRGLYLGRWCVENRVDHIHAHFLTSPTTVALIASAVSGVPYSYTAHAHDITSRRPQNMSGSIELKMHGAAIGFTISNYNQRYMLERWPEMAGTRLEVIYNGIDTELFSVNADHISANREMRRVISVSRLVAKKGYEFLIRAVVQLHHEGVNLQLDIFGDGPQRRALLNLIERLEAKQYITLHGAILQEELVGELHKSEVFALASVPSSSGDSDGLPTVLIEALATGLPTVSTQVTGIPEIIQDRVTGLCVPPGDVQQLAEAIQWMLDHRKEAHAMGLRGRQLVLDQFDRRKNAQKLLTCWREIHAPC